MDVNTNRLQTRNHMTAAATFCVLKAFELGSDQANTAVGHTSPSPKVRGKDTCRQNYLVLGVPLRGSKTGEKLAQRAFVLRICLYTFFFKGNTDFFERSSLHHP